MNFLLQGTTVFTKLVRLPALCRFLALEKATQSHGSPSAKKLLLSILPKYALPSEAFAAFASVGLLVSATKNLQDLP